MYKKLRQIAHLFLVFSQEKQSNFVAFHEKIFTVNARKLHAKYSCDKLNYTNQKNIPDKCVAGKVPAKVIKQIENNLEERI